jgi:chromosome segregation protein
LAADAEEHRRLAAELAELLAVSYSHRWQALRQRYTNAASAVDAALADEEEARARLHDAVERLNAGRSEATALRQRHDTLSNELRHAQSAADRAEHAAAFAVREAERLADQCKRLAEDADDADRRAAREDAALAETNRELEQVRAEIAQLEHAPQARADIEAAEQRLAQARRRWADWRSASASLDAERRATNALRERLAADLRALATTPDDPPADPALDEQIARTSRRVADLTRQIEQLLDERRTVRQRVADAHEQLARLRGERAALAERLRECERRLSQLVREEEAGDAYHPAVRTVLEGAGRRFASSADTRRVVASVRLTGIVGTVADLLDVPAGYELAFEAALGGRSQDIVVERWQEAEAAIQFLRATGAGRATFLPLDTIQPRRRASWPAEPGVHGVAADLCRYDPRLRAVVDRLLGAIVIVDDLTVARRCLARNGQGHQFVTLSGETVGSWGAISGGSPPSRRDGLLRRRTEHAALAAEREQLTARAVELDHRIAAAQRELSVSQEAERRIANELDAREPARAEASRALANLEARAEQRRVATDAAARRREQVAARLAELTAEDTALAERLDALERQQTDLAQQRETIEQEVAEAEAAVDRARERASAATARLAALRAAERGLVATVRRIEATVERERARATEARARHAQVARQLETCQADAERHRDVAAAALARAENAQMRALELARLRQRHEADLDRLIEQEHAARAAAAASAERLAAARRERETAAEALDQLRSRMAADGIDPDQLPPPSAAPDPTEVDRQVMRLRARLRATPSAGTAVIDEYEQERARLDDFSAQIADLHAAEANLSKTIVSLETLIAERFDQTVAAVNHEFRRYFQRLFGGGTARLGVGDGSGIEIEAHPPGKRPQSLGLLSGGERALTAAALVFALLRVNPIPFCVLDEVDAALDESNVRRFVDALRELATTTQFVVITHNRVTMEAAEAVYGLTVGGDGATKIVSVQLRPPTP